MFKAKKIQNILRGVSTLSLSLSLIVFSISKRNFLAFKHFSDTSSKTNSLFSTKKLISSNSWFSGITSGLKNVLGKVATGVTSVGSTLGDAAVNTVKSVAGAVAPAASAAASVAASAAAATANNPAVKTIASSVGGLASGLGGLAGGAAQAAAGLVSPLVKPAADLAATVTIKAAEQVSSFTGTAPVVEEFAHPVVVQFSFWGGLGLLGALLWFLL